MLLRVLRFAAVVMLGFTSQLILSNPVHATVAISSFSPAAGPVGTSVTVSGSGFSSYDNVLFAGVATTSQLYLNGTPQKLVVTVPTGAVTGRIRVNGTVSTDYDVTTTNFVVTPTLNNLSPTTGTVGNSVTLTGSNFASPPSANSVTFNGTPALVGANSTTSVLYLTVPANATTGPIAVTVAGVTQNGPTFTVTCPSGESVTTLAGLAGVAGSTDGSGTNARFNEPASLAVDASGNIFVADWANDTIRKITAGGAVTTFAGQAGVRGGANGTGTAAQFTLPDGIVMDTAGNLYIADTGNDTIRKITPAGVVSTLAGVAGMTGSVDGTGSAARFSNPNGITIDSAGNLYTVDTANQTVRKITPGGVVTTIAGSPGLTGTADGTGSAARFASPQGITIDSAGNLYVADTSNSTIRKITPAGVVTTIAGLAGTNGSTDGTGTAARFYYPYSIAADSLNNLYVADTYNQTIRLISPSGVVSTIAGTVGKAATTDGIASAAAFNYPDGIAVDSAGNIYVAEWKGHTVRKLVAVSNCPKPTCSSMGPKNATVAYNATTTRFYAYGVQNASTVYFPTWWVDGGNQNDIQWLEGSNDGGGTWHVDVPLSQYDPNIPRYGNFATHVYVASANYQGNTPQFCDSTGWVRQSPPPPDVPTAITAPASTNSGVYNVSWTAATTGNTVTTFTLQQATSLSGPWTTLSSAIPASSPSYSVGVNTSGTYYYQVAACNSYGCSAFKQSSGVVATLSVPTCTSIGFATNPVPYGTNTQRVYVYGVQNATTVYFPTWWIPGNQADITNPWPTGTNQGGGTWYVDLDLTKFDPGTPRYGAFETDVYMANTTYHNGSAVGCGPSSWTRSQPPPPNAPASVSVPTSSTVATISVNWTPSSSGPAATYYTVQRGPSSSGSNWTLVGSPASAPVSDDVPAAGTYYYEVAACNASGCSGYTVSSNGVSVSGPAGVTLSALPTETTDTLPTHDATVGTVTGSAGTSGGGATYTVPIIVPPGRAGMQPALALNYNSRSGNGPMGMGWSISGLSSIHRCPQTPEQDGQAMAVSYAASDRLCLDGQRLVLTNGSSSITYGAATAQYDTEVARYGRITQVGTLTDNTGCFKVEQKDGRIFHYGGVVSADGKTCTITAGNHSRVNPNATTPLSWLIEKIEDRAGNYETFSYTDFGSGEVLIQTITYTLPDSTMTLDRTVSFAYQARTSAPTACATDSTKCATDVSSSYLAGGVTMQTQVLASITTAVGGTTVRTYTPSYSAAAYSGRLLMNSLTECAYSGTSSACHPATTFVYNDSALNYKLKPLGTNIGLPAPVADTNSTAIQTQPVQFSMIADLDGDGTREAAAVVPLSDTKHYFLVQLTGDRAAQSVIDLTGTGYSASIAVDFDVDGSGRSALIQSPSVSGDDPHVSLNVWSYGRGVVYTPPVDASGNQNPSSNFTTLFKHFVTTIPYDLTKAPHSYGATILAADLDADGKPDLIVIQQDSTCGTDAVGKLDGVFFYRNTTSGTLSATNSPTFTTPSGHLFCLARTVPNAADPSTYAEETIDHIGDFDGDGRPDFFLSFHDSRSIPTTIIQPTFSGVALTQAGAGSVTRINPLTCDPNAANGSTLSVTDECYGQHGYATFWLDVNGDGLEDFVIARPYSTEQDAQHNALPPTWRVRLNQGRGVLGSEINTLATDGLITDSIGTSFGSNVFRYAGKLPPMDVDSDGKPELLIPSSFAVKMCTLKQVPVQNNGEGCPASGSQPFLPTGSISSTAPTIQCAAWACPEDVDSDNLTMPANASGTTNGFPAQWQDVAPGSNPSVPVLPAFGAYTANSQHNGPGFDSSLYHLAALKFVQTDATHVSLKRVQTPAIGRLSDQSTSPQDLFGDGLADLTATIGCTNQPIQVIPGQASSAFYSHICSVVADGTNGPNAALDDAGTLPCTAQSDGTCYFGNHPVLYANINQGTAALGGSSSAPLRAGGIQRPATPRVQQRSAASAPLLGTPILPGLMDAVVDGFGDVTSWGYLPLSVPESTYGFPLYSVPSGSGYTDDRHYYFQSSMPVVYGMLQSPAVGSDYGGFRSAVYGYSQAMYNHFGRGFEGFYQIISQVYVPASAPATMQARVEKTLTTYNQKFPLVGKVQQVQRYDVTTGVLLEQEDDKYICGLGSRTDCPQGSTLPTPTSTTLYAPVLDKQTVKNFDLHSAAQYAETDVVNANGSTSGWDSYGNLTYQTVTHLDKGSPLFLNSTSGQTTTTSNTYDTSDTTNWWVNKLTQSSVSSSIAYDPSHPLPTGATAPAQTVTTNFTWNTDRTPATKTVQSGITNQQSTTTFTYPSTSYGLATQIKICLGSYDSSNKCSGAAGSGNGDPGSALSPQRTTSVSYTKDGSTAAADGYFVLTTTDGLGHATTTTHQTNDGQVLVAIDPNNVQVTTTYDPFGRALTVDHTGNNGATFESQLKIAYTSCLDTNFPANSGHCAAGVGEDNSNESNAAYRVTTVQAGYPTKIAWYDILAREIKTAERGYDGTFIETLTDYDDMGTVSEKFSPFYTTGSPTYFTSWTYDTLNRPTLKQESRGDINAAAGNQNGDFVTSYGYSGRVTTIKAYAANLLQSDGTCKSGSGNLCISMTRSQNALGQYMQTVDAMNGTTNYWTEPLGHVAAITDPESNLTTGTYNALGQRTSSKDPDQGTWLFTYDALGEMLTQTDARGVVTTVNKRDVLGRTTEQQQVPPSGSIAGLDANLVVDDWTYDPVNGIGELDTVVRYRGTNTKTPLNANNPQVWEEQYTYESATARLSSITTTIAGAGGGLVSQLGYDSNGRQNKHTYPDNFVATTQYAQYGHPGAIANGAGTIYWKATAMDAWGKVTRESYADGTNGTIVNYQSTGQESTASWTLAGGTADSLTYLYDTFGNLSSNTRTTDSASNRESYTYDPLQRLVSAMRSNGPAVNYAYTASGNLKYKDDFSINSGTGSQAYSYGANGCGAHAASSVVLPGSKTATYQCDANGNVIGGSTLSGTFDADNRPTLMTRTGAGSQSWTYGSGGMSSETSSAGTRYFAPGGYEQIGTTTTVHELGPIIVRISGGVTTVTTALRDRLGSTIATIDNGIQFPGSARTYDAFGKVRNGDFSDKANGTLNLADTIHGFTQHDHADDVQLIHMGGRIYDYSLGRFLSVDPIIRHSTNTQGLNPYSYILNNPLSGTDPSGYADDAPEIGTICGAMAQGSNCPGVSSTQVASPSLSAQNNATAAGLASQANNITHVVADSGASSQSSSGAGGPKNAQAAASDQGALSNAPTTEPGQPHTLETISVWASAKTGQALNGGWAVGYISQDMQNAEWHWWYDYYEREVANETMRGMAREFVVKPIIFALGGIYFGAVAGDVLYLGEGTELAAAEGGDAVSYANPRSLLPIQGRAEMTGSTVQRMAKEMKRDGYSNFDPVNTVDVNGKQVIVDGHHRTAAAIRAGLREIPVQQVPATAEQKDQLLQWVEEARATKSH